MEVPKCDIDYELIVIRKTWYGSYKVDYYLYKTIESAKSNRGMMKLRKSYIASSIYKREMVVRGGGEALVALWGLTKK